MLNPMNAHLGTDIFYLSMITLFFVFILLIAALLTFKQPAGIDSSDNRMKRGIELAWALIPFVMLFVMLIPIIQMVMH